MRVYTIRVYTITIGNRQYETTNVTEAWCFAIYWGVAKLTSRVVNRQTKIENITRS